MTTIKTKTSLKITAKKPAQRYPVPALDKGLDLLELLATHPRGMSLSELSVAASRKVSEIFRMVDCLKRRGFVGHDKHSDKLVLTMRLFELAHRYPPTERMIAAALPEMEALTREVGQSCHLAVYSAGEMLVIAQIDSPLQMGFAVHVGARVGLMNSASGRVYLSFQNLDDRHRILALQEGADETVATQKVEVFVKQIQKKGFESVPSDLIRGVTNMSYPVLDFSGRCAAALTIPFLQWDADNHASKEVTLKRLGQAAQAVSSAIGALPA
jgi:DNA-binding IclR family transcriptional regulator